MPKGVYQRDTKTAPKKPVKTKKTKAGKDLPDVLRLARMEVLELENSSAKIRACDSEIMVAVAQKNATIAQLDPQGILASYDARIQALKLERSEAEQRQRATRTAVEERLAIDLSHFSYDDETGTLHKITDTAPIPTSP